MVMLREFFGKGDQEVKGAGLAWSPDFSSQ